MICDEIMETQSEHNEQVDETQSLLRLQSM